jgi:hypothetical protein
MRVANNTGSAFAIAVGANAAAAAAATPIAVVHAGQTSEGQFTVSLANGDKVWVRSFESTDVTSGQLLVTFY